MQRYNNEFLISQHCGRHKTQKNNSFPLNGPLNPADFHSTETTLHNRPSSVIVIRPRIPMRIRMSLILDLR